MASKTFRDVALWKRAHRWVLAVYRFTSGFPKDERFGLTSQLRRAAVSIPGNFAEGFKKQSRLDKARYYNVAQASMEECRYYLVLAADLGYGDPQALATELADISRMLEGYKRSMLKAAP